MVTKEECEWLVKSFGFFDYKADYTYVDGTCYISVSKTYDDGYEEATLEISGNIIKYNYTRDIFLEAIDGYRYRILPPGGTYVEGIETTSFNILSVDLGEGKTGINVNMRGRVKPKELYLAVSINFIPSVERW